MSFIRKTEPDKNNQYFLKNNLSFLSARKNAFFLLSLIRRTLIDNALFRFPTPDRFLSETKFLPRFRDTDA